MLGFSWPVTFKTASKPPAVRKWACLHGAERKRVSFPHPPFPLHFPQRTPHFRACERLLVRYLSNGESVKEKNFND